MTVWIVHTGCKYEGGSTKVICSSEQKAIWWAKNFVKRENKQWSGKYKRLDSNLWENSGDIVWISERKVQ